MSHARQARAGARRDRLPPTATRGEFTIEADKLDTWNAVGQIAVRTRQAAECEAGAGRKKGKRS